MGVVTQLPTNKHLQEQVDQMAAAIDVLSEVLAHLMASIGANSDAEKRYLRTILADVAIVGRESREGAGRAMLETLGRDIEHYEAVREAKTKARTPA